MMEWLDTVYQSIYFLFNSVFTFLVPPGLVAMYITHRNTKKVMEKQFNLNRQVRYSEQLLPVFLEILDDLWILHEVFVFKGRYCPPIEHRSPNLDLHDDEKNEITSYAKREYAFREIGQRLIQNCRKISFLSNEEKLRKTITTCKEIKNYLTRKEKGKKRHFDRCLISLTSYLTEKHHDEKGLLNEAEETLLSFRDQLEKSLEKEFPTLEKID